MPAEIRQQLEALDDEWHQQHNRFSEQQKCLFIRSNGWEESKPACRTSARRLNRRSSHDYRYAESSCWQSAKRNDRGDAAWRCWPLLSWRCSLKNFPPEKHHRGGYSALAGSRSRPLKEVNIRRIWTPKATYQQAQLLSTPAVYRPAPQILGKLHQLQSPFAAQARSWWMTMPPLPRRCIRCFYSAGA